MASTSNKIKQSVALRLNEIDKMNDLKAIADRAVREEALYESLYPQFKARFAHIDQIYNEFHKHHSALLLILSLLEDIDIEPHRQIRTDFDANFYEIQSTYATLFAKPDLSISAENINARTSNEDLTASGNHSRVKLPRIDLFKFDGNVKTWRTFIDMFNATVHNNSSLSDIEKFNYLISSLNNEPLSIVSCTPMTTENYPTAYNALIKRYENKRLHATTYWQEIENSPNLTDSCNSIQIRNLVNIFKENLAALKSLEFPVDQWDFILFNMLLKRLDSATVTRFELSQTSLDQVPTFDSLVDFLFIQCRALDTVSHNSLKFALHSSKSPSFLSKSKQTSSLFANTVKLTCPLCTSDHQLYKCSKFLAKSPRDRFEMVKKHKFCLNCLGSRHLLGNCKSTSTCRECQQKHHTLLHFPRTSSSASTTVNAVSVNPISSLDSDCSTSLNHVNSFTNIVASKTTVLLSTAIVELQDRFGCFKPVRVLLDSGSQANFISEKCANRLGLSRAKLSFVIHGLGSMNAAASQGVSCKLRPTGKLEPEFNFEAIVLPVICNDMPASSISRSSWPHITNLKLADPKFGVSRSVDMLLGADIFPQILESGHLPGKCNEPTALNTKFGWVLMGGVGSSSKYSDHVNSFCAMINSSPLDTTIQRFWELEEVPSASFMSDEDNQAEEIFKSSYFRTSSGRFVVPLPFKTKNPVFPDSRSIALRRFNSLERRLSRDRSLRDLYVDFMRDYLSSGHMQIISSCSTDDGYYIPHQCVLKPDSPSTKLRVVFDGSARSTSGYSLNDTLLIGPKLQKNINSILCRFRFHTFVFTADIRQMFRQILVLEEHRRFQKILWRFSPEESIQEYQLNTVTYGTSAAPYLALRTIIELAKSENRFPLASKVLLDDIYVDDVVTGSSTLSATLELQDQVISLLQSGGFELRKWASNHSSLLDKLPKSYRHILPLSFDNSSNSCIKILGLQWHPTLDSFSYSVQPLDRPCTKRSLLSELARIYDPIGFLAPLTFYTKHLIQHLWTLGLDWDESPPADILSRWVQFKTELPLLSSLHIPRRLMVDHFHSCEMHGFCDASELGYAAVIYFRYVVSSNEVVTHFVHAKSKVAPLKRISIPRLELCAAVLLAKLINFTVQVFEDMIKFDQIHAWSDSTITLAWIKSSPHRWKTFVANRVTQIHSFTTANSWHHVSSQDNPSDCASRGLYPSDLMSHPLWWTGPPWLRNTTLDLYPESELPTDSIPEERTIVLTAFIDENIFDSLLVKFSSLNKILGILAYCTRVFKPKIHSSLVVSELEQHHALLLIVKHVQAELFSKEIANLGSRNLSKPFRKLSPFLDDRGVFRVGGRLGNSSISFDAKHPILLPGSHRLTELIIEDMHKRHCHPGLQTLHFLLRQKFWIIGSKRAISKIVSRCYQCFRVKPTSIQPPMSDLPSLRVSQLKAFSCAGVDYGGPFSITLGKSRGIKSQKAYICLFVCFSTKAVHLELVSELSTEAFLAALRRFISRRGRCSVLHSDNGTNFVGAHRELSRLMQTCAESERIEWHFNPPSAPHFGGIWEAGIKSVKNHLYRVIGEQILTYEEFYTVLVRIEALLNSRPLCPLSSDPNDLTALTPGHFLTLEPLSSLPDPDLTHLKIGRLNRWQLLQRMHQDFWSRWHGEYLHTLQQRSKWTVASTPIVIDTLVLIKSDLVPPLKWQLARVTAVHPGADGVVRVVTVRTTQGTIKRPVVKICPLPLL